MKEETSSYADTLKNKRKAYGISQNKLAVMASLPRQYICEVETGKTIPPADKQELISTALEKLNLEYMLHEDYGFYSYTEHYVMGDIYVLTSPDLEKGVLLELKGQGCRQTESYLEAQERSWYDFLLDCLVEGGVMKRLDLAINDMAGILNIPELTEKSMNEECVSVFRTFKSYRSGELVKSREQDKLGMETPYISVH